MPIERKPLDIDELPCGFCANVRLHVAGRIPEHRRTPVRKFRQPPILQHVLSELSSVSNSRWVHTLPMLGIDGPDESQAVGCSAVSSHVFWRVGLYSRRGSRRRLDRVRVDGALVSQAHKSMAMCGIVAVKLEHTECCTCQ